MKCDNRAFIAAYHVALRVGATQAQLAEALGYSHQSGVSERVRRLREGGTVLPDLQRKVTMKELRAALAAATG